MFRYYSPESTVVGLVGVLIFKLLGGGKKRSAYTDSSSSERKSIEEQNVATMQKVCDAHADCTAEVIPFTVIDRENVEMSRGIHHGDKVELSLDGSILALSLRGIELSTKIVPDDSLLPRVFREGVKFDAYLGGRTPSFKHDTMDFIDIIVFYKLEGVPPTTVELH